MKTTKNTQPSNALAYIFSKCWRYSKGNKGSVIGFWVMFIFAGLVDVFVVPLAWAKILDIIQTSGGITSENISQLIWLLVLMPVSKALFWGLHGPARVIEVCNAFMVRANYRQYLLDGILKLPLEWHSEHHSGNTIDRVNKGTQALFDFAEDSFEIIYAFVKLIGSCAMLVWFFPLSLPILFVMSILTCWVIVRFDKKLVPQYVELNKAENRVTESNQDAISNITTIVILRVALPVYKAIVEKIMKPFGLFRKNSVINEVKWFLTSMCCVLTTTIVVAAYFMMCLSDSQTVLVGGVYLLWRNLGNINDLCYMVAARYSDIVKRKTQIMNAEEIAEDFRDMPSVEHALPEIWKTLSVRNLNFAYANGKTKDGAEPPARLRNVSFDLHRGEKVAVIGKSGSGKTTLLKAMRDLYHSRTLDLSVDGTSIDHGFKGIAEAIALVPQCPEMFTTTVLENLTLGVGHDDQTVMRFCALACFADVVFDLPKGFQSSVKEDGMNLSGGQQQRLALARALLASMDREILLLDEATSSLDAPTEVRVYENIFKEFAKKTVVASIHRLHLLSRFDRVLLFKDGEIIADGTPDSLHATCPEFQEMWRQYERNPDRQD